MRARGLILALVLAATATPALAQLPALRDRPLSAAERTRLTSLETQFARVSQQRSVSVAAVRAIAQALGERLTTQDPDLIVRAIDERAQELGVARTRISQLERDLEAMDSMRLAQAVGPLLTAAGAAIEAGDLALAESRLAEAGERFASARQSLQVRVDQLGSREADIFAQRAAVRSSVFDRVGAAALYAQAAEATPASDSVARWRYRLAEARTLIDQGESASDPQARLRAIALIREQTLPLAPRAERPAEWAETQQDLGRALIAAGRENDDTALMDQGVAALRLALEATPASAPIDTGPRRRIVLATTLSDLAERRNDGALAEAAVADFRVAFAALSVKRANDYLAFSSALSRLATLKQNEQARAEAVRIAREGLAGVDGAAAPRDFAALNLTLSYLLLVQGLNASDATLVEQANAAAAAALAAIDRERFPALWVQANRRLGSNHSILAQLRGPADTTSLPEAVRRLTAALDATSYERSANDWLILNLELAYTTAVQATRENSLPLLEQALARFRTLDARADGDSYMLLRVRTKYAIAHLLADVASRSTGAARRERFTEALAAFDVAMPLVRANLPAAEVATFEPPAAQARAEAAAPEGAPPPSCRHSIFALTCPATASAAPTGAAT